MELWPAAKKPKQTPIKTGGEKLSKPEKGDGCVNTGFKGRACWLQYKGKMTDGCGLYECKYCHETRVL